MDRMILLLCGTLVVLPVTGVVLVKPEPALASEVLIDRWHKHITEASRRLRVPEAWIRAVMKAESGGQTMLDGRPITSPAGAMGLMQLMPETWHEMQKMHGLGSDPHDPRDNILAGTAYLRAMHIRFGYPGLFAAYNAGPARCEEHLRTGKPLPAETRAYIKKLVNVRTGVSASPQKAETQLFFPLETPESGVSGDHKARTKGEIFVPLGTGSTSR